ncbi:zinc finger protein 300-like [Acipenser ruthenus]|uniref:zinc finger protein 300-like n=1 Tax=Acipenser ruthenus TaxID=7906 RepID=UPI0027411052|nr:zinc finger protein 300-like [Acipenser ruthenus]
MEVSVSVSFFQDELASTIEHAVKAAVDTVLCQITKVVGGKFTEFRMEMAGKEKENESLKLRLEISESELKAVRECMNAADADIKQPLRNMNPDCNEQDFQRIENQGLFQDPKESHTVPESEAQEGPRMEAVYKQEESFDQEWCASLKQDTELTCVKDEEVPRLECVPIKEEFIEQECVPIAEEVPTENNVCTLEENNQLGSNLCDDCPPECELGFGAAKGNQTGDTPFPCADCGKRFSCLSQLEIHQRVHTGEKPYHCNDCGKRFTQLGHLQAHQRIHTGEKPYHCGECGRSFSRSPQLKSHQRSHTGEKLYHCTVCGKRFTRVGNLQSHQRIHTGEKPYHCTECGRSFTYLSSLKIHQRTHKKEKSYQCSECLKSFSHLSNLKRHHKIHTRVQLVFGPPGRQENSQNFSQLRTPQHQDYI